MNASVRTESEIAKSRKLKFGSQANLALCCLKLGQHEECKRACHFAMGLEPDNEKVLFRRAQSHLASRNFNEAIEDFEAVLRVNPSNSAAKQQIEQCHAEIKAYKIKEKELYDSFLLRKKKANATRKVINTFHLFTYHDKQLCFF